MALLDRNVLHKGPRAPTIADVVTTASLPEITNPLSPSWKPPIYETPYKFSKYYLERIVRKFSNQKRWQAPFDQGNSRAHLGAAKEMLDTYGPEIAARIIVWGINYAKHPPSLWWLSRTAGPKFIDRWNTNRQTTLL